MAHTTTIDEWYLTHNGDALRGDVQIEVPLSVDARAITITIPGSVLAEFVANAVRNAKIGHWSGLNSGHG